MRCPFGLAGQALERGHDAGRRLRHVGDRLVPAQHLVDADETDPILNSPKPYVANDAVHPLRLVRVEPAGELLFKAMHSPQEGPLRLA